MEDLIDGLLGYTFESALMSLATGSTLEFSIITAVLNRADYLANCLDSVAMQRGTTVEHIVIDGGSTDGSADILVRRSGQLAHWSSEPDQGISDAMNKGIARARGKWLLFLHADDQLIRNDSLQQVAAALGRTSARIAAFPIQHGSATSRRVLRPRGTGLRMYLKAGFMHQGTFVARSVFDEIGGFDTSLKIAMDYDFLLRALQRRIPIICFAAPVPTWMRDTGVSSLRDWPSLRKRFAEERSIHYSIARSSWQRALYATYWPLYLGYRRLRSLWD